MKFASICSLLLLLIASGWAIDYREVYDQVKAESPREGVRILRSMPDLMEDEHLRDRIEATERANYSKQVWELVVLDLRLLWETGDVGFTDRDEIKAQAKEIKRDEKYREAPSATNESWVVTAIRRLERLLDMMDRPNQSGPPAMAFGPWLTYLVWGVVGGVVAFLVFLAVKYILATQKLRLRSKALIDEEDEAKTLDEWLGKADELAAEGRYREAVRALYVSCLLKMDEAGIARFDRSETNWEHLHRIHASAKRPEGLDFLPTTQAFDRIWYGNHVRGRDDFEAFRNWYAGVETLVRGMS